MDNINKYNTFRYGTDAASVTNNALSTAGNSYLTFYNAAAMGPKGIAKRVAKVSFNCIFNFIVPALMLWD